MALKGHGAVIIWNDIAPDGRDDFYDWHVNEHIPERVAIPGFLRGRRYIAIDGDTKPEFLTLYETENTAVLSGADYLARLNTPTTWTKRATSHFRATSRCLARTILVKGQGVGRYVASLRIEHTEGGLDLCHRLKTDAEKLGDHLVGGTITGMAICLSEIEISAIKTEESKGRTDILQPPIGGVLIEAVSENALRTVVAQASDLLAPLTDAEWGYYAFEFGLF
jgi:hypothetical protein